MITIDIRSVLERLLVAVGWRRGSAGAAAVIEPARPIQPAPLPPTLTCTEFAHPLPAQAAPGSPLRDRRAAVVLFSSFPGDARPRRAAETLVREGMKVEMICLRHDRSEPARENWAGVDVRRLPLQHHRGSKLGYMFRYCAFLFWAGCLLAVRSLSRRYALVHVHNMPDVLVFSALIPKLLGARVILDLHDPMPELMNTIYKAGYESRSVRLLKRLERISIGFAHRVITVNLACQKIFTARSCPPAKLHIVMNSPDEEVFGYREAVVGPPRGPGQPFVIMYHGSLIARNGLDLAVRALETVRRAEPNAILRVYGHRTPFLEEVLNSIQGTDLAPAVQYLGGKKVEEVAHAIDECDVGVIPNRRNVFTELNTPTRIFEYLARGKPVIAPRAPGIQDYFSDQQIIFFELGDAEDLARQILRVASAPGEILETVRRGQEIYRAHSWSEERRKFVELVRELVPAPRA
jgi:glycosyltransferase involved in cell wall biosynthesis